jgi:hypothetical protein
MEILAANRSFYPAVKVPPFTAGRKATVRFRQHARPWAGHALPYKFRGICGKKCFVPGEVTGESARRRWTSERVLKKATISSPLLRLVVNILKSKALSSIDGMAKG